MYPTSPTVTDWRKIAAADARRAGAEVPYWYDGTDASLQRLGAELPTIKAAVLWYQNRYAADHPGDFPPNIVEASNAWLARNPAPTEYASGFALQSYGLGAAAVDFVSAGANQAAEWTADGFTSAKSLLGIEPTLPPPAKKPMHGFGLVALTGIAIGATAWYVFGRKVGA